MTSAPAAASAAPPAIPYDQRAARRLVRPLARLGVSPNQVTAFTLVLAVFAAILFATGDRGLAGWAAALFVVARFCDHLDGELARRTGRGSRFGYYFDYVAGAASYALLFAGLALGFCRGPLGGWALVLGAAGVIASLGSLGLNLDLDRRRGLTDGDAVGYPALGGFELEDGIYLLAPVTWAGALPHFFVAAGIGATVYCGWTWVRVLRARAGTGGGNRR